MMKTQWMTLVVALVISVFAVSTASAATISPTVLPVASGPGLGLVSVPAIFTTNPNNDNQIGGGAEDNNVLIPLKRFDFNDYIDIVFTANVSAGITEYKVTEFVDNNTGVAWSAYKMQLGLGTGVNFVPVTAGPLTFDAPNYDTPPGTSGPLTTIGTSPYQLNFSGGLQGTGAQQYSFRLDVPNFFTAASGQFTLRQIPTAVPEPAAVAMIAVTLMGFVASRRRS
jgi:hypothetical protein